NPAMAALTSDVNIGRHRCHSGAPGSQSAGQVTPVAPSMSAEMRIFTWSEADADVLHFDVFLDPLTPALAAEPGRLDPAERCRRGGDDPRVQADHAELERLGSLDGTVQIAGVDVGNQTVLGGVGLSVRLIVGAKGRDRGD